MKLKVKKLGLDSGGKTVVIVNEDDARELGVRSLDRIVVRKGNKKITAVVNTTKKFVKEGQMVVYHEVASILGLKDNQYVDAEPREELESKKFIRKKIDGGELSYNEMKSIVDDVIERDLNDLELSAFVTALHIRGLSLNESVAMSKAMIDTSKTIKFPGTVVDKHSIGGVPGDKTSMLLVPIIASTSLTIPKTSSRSITSPAGTADRMEVLAPVEHGISEIKRIVKKTNGCLVWGGAVDLAPADDLLIRVEHPLSLDPLLLPSVMSKKKSVGSKFLVVDIPTGPEAKVKNKREAERLAKNFIKLGKKIDIKADCGITRGDQPVGYAMGPALEAKEALAVIMSRDIRSDLIDKVTSLSGILLKMVGRGSKSTAENIILSGAAERKFREIIKAQGGNEKIMPQDIPYADNKLEIKSGFDGIIGGINNRDLVAIAKTAGAPKDRLAGVLLNKKIEHRVKKNEVIFTIYAEKKYKLKKAEKMVNSDIFTIFDHKKRKMLMEEVRR